MLLRLRPSCHSSVVVDSLYFAKVYFVTPVDSSYSLVTDSLVIFSALTTWLLMTSDAMPILRMTWFPIQVCNLPFLILKVRHPDL